MSGYPHEPGHRGADTSIGGAAHIAPVANQLRALVYQTLWRHPAGLTVDELCGVVDRPRYSLQPRFTELKHAGSIRDTGKRRRNESGCKAIVWAVAEPQEKAA